MTTRIDTITCDQIHGLQADAAQAGDEATVRDCRTVIDALLYLGSDDPTDVTGERRDALARIVAVIADAEARQD